MYPMYSSQKESIILNQVITKLHCANSPNCFVVVLFWQQRLVKGGYNSTASWNLGHFSDPVNCSHFSHCRQN